MKELRLMGGGHAASAHSGRPNAIRPEQGEQEVLNPPVASLFPRGKHHPLTRAPSLQPKHLLL